MLPVKRGAEDHTGYKIITLFILKLILQAKILIGNSKFTKQKYIFVHKEMKSSSIFIIFL